MEIIVEGSTIYNGDCLEVMDTMNKCSVDSIVTDPPYHLTSMTSRYGKADAKECGYGNDGSFRRLSKGFMGKEWDGGDIAFQSDTWRKCYELLKPGGHLIAFSGSRTYHRMAVAIEDAGFEIRDQCIWLYGSGFPKSHNIGNGWGTALKPAHEPMVLARKPIEEKSVAENVAKHGVGGINIDDCRVQCEPDDNIVRPERTESQAYNFFRGGEEDVTNVRKTTRRQPRNEQSVWTDNNSGMKAESSMFADADPRGRFPSNVMHDGSDAVENIFPKTSPSNPSKRTRNTVGMFGMPNDATPEYSDSGTASRYFYTAKTNQAERNAGLHGFDPKFAPTMGDGIGVKEHNEQTATKKKNVHPTVKPVELMKYLVRLVTPKNGLVLDPFMGSGSTGMAAREEDFQFIGIEKDEEYYEIAKARIKNVKPQLKLFDI
jgi:site-specific DNA-methyltransferase (adenine-specific)